MYAIVKKFPGICFRLGIPKKIQRNEVVEFPMLAAGRALD